jgi:ankyrin repeat protein
MDPPILCFATNAEDIQRGIREGADVNRPLESGVTPLHVFANEPAICALLIEHGADPNAKTYSTYETPLHSTSHPEVVKLLLASGADPEAQDIEGRTALHRSVAFHDRDADWQLKKAHALIEGGAQVDAWDYSFNTPLHVCGAVASAKLLLENGAKGEVANQDGNWPGDQFRKSDNLQGVQEFILDFVASRHSLKALQANTPPLSDIFNADVPTRAPANRAMRL